MPATVIYDGDCAICTRIKEITGRLDWFGTMRWLPLQSPEAARFGISREQLEASVYLVSESGTTHGWQAAKRILPRVPLTWLVAAIAVRKQPWMMLAAAVAFSPVGDPAGEAVYGFVARNRYRFPGSTCSTALWDNQRK